MSNCTLKVTTTISDFTATSSQAAVSLPKVGSSNLESQPFVGTYGYRKHFNKPRLDVYNEDGVVIGRDT